MNYMKLLYRQRTIKSRIRFLFCKFRIYQLFTQPSRTSKIYIVEKYGMTITSMNTINYICAYNRSVIDLITKFGNTINTNIFQ